MLGLTNPWMGAIIHHNNYSSHKAWTTLQHMFTSDSSEVNHKLKKSSHSVAEYITETIGITNPLTIASNNVPDNDLVLFALSGLRDGFESFIQSVSTRTNIISFLDL